VGGANPFIQVLSCNDLCTSRASRKCGLSRWSVTHGKKMGGQRKDVILGHTQDHSFENGVLQLCFLSIAPLVLWLHSPAQVSVLGFILHKHKGTYRKCCAWIIAPIVLWLHSPAQVSVLGFVLHKHKGTYRKCCAWIIAPIALWLCSPAQVSLVSYSTNTKARTEHVALGLSLQLRSKFAQLLTCPWFCNPQTQRHLR